MKKPKQFTQEKHQRILKALKEGIPLPVIILQEESKYEPGCMNIRVAG